MDLGKHTNRTHRDNQKHFHFPDVSQINEMIGNFPDISAKSGTVGKQQNP